MFVFTNIKIFMKTLGDYISYFSKLNVEELNMIHFFYYEY